ncbi:hypothetical protein BN8_03776 [Fibrisoma limi BUZ 3]|uniref:Uncharacterized protein n=2 Tax=Fibrisoma limi TaxID=663275 RepID=I2GL16_9BACT|nr:hypothetical protein BN8_03776 [Fibrisoma limi BUZ 3]
MPNQTYHYHNRTAMKYLLSFLLIIGFTDNVFSQWLTQSAEGQGSFLFKGSNIGIDLGKSEFSFTMNNLHKPVQLSSSKDNSFAFYGIGLKAKSEEGLGNLFSTGDLVPSAKLNGYFGWQLSNSYNAVRKASDAELSGQLQALTIDQIKRRFIPLMEIAIDEEINFSPLTNTVVKAKLSTDWVTQLRTSQPKTFHAYLSSYLAAQGAAIPAPDQILVSNIITNLLSRLKSIVQTFDLELKVLKDELVKSFEQNIRNTYWRVSLFTFGGIDALSFRRVDQINTGNLSKSFIKEEFRGGNLGVGLNWQVDWFKLGLTYAYKKTNNFNLLDKTEYKLTTTTPSTSISQILTQERAITGYSGTYGEVEINELNADLLLNISLGKESETYTLINPYFRSNLLSRNKLLLPDSYSFGFGTYFFSKQSKFLGGLYVELPDVENAYEKLKPIEDQNIRTAIRRFNFGIVAKFSLNSIISSQ